MPSCGAAARRSRSRCWASVCWWPAWRGHCASGRSRWPRRRTPLERARVLLDEPVVAGLAFPLGHAPLGFVLGQAIALLHLAGELIAAAGDDVPVVVGQLAPLFLGLARQLLPVALNAVPVH